MRDVVLLIAAVALSVCNGVDASARIPRSAVAKRDFQRDNPCPANDQRRGACPGYEIDHVNPLKCGGADTPANMQWLTVEQHKEKTRFESVLCRK